MKSTKFLLLLLLTLLIGGTLTFSHANAAPVPTGDIPGATNAVGADDAARIARDHLMANSADLGLSADIRELGMGLIAMRLDTEP